MSPEMESLKNMQIEMEDLKKKLADKDVDFDRKLRALRAQYMIIFSEVVKKI